MTDFWKRVQSLLTQDLNKTWLASEIGVSVNTLSNWVARDNDPKASQAQAMADALGVSVEYLVTGKNSYLEDFPQNTLLSDNLKNATYVRDHKKSLTTNKPQALRNIPFYNVDLTYSNIQRIQDNILQPQHTITHEPFSTCDFCIRAIGNSMEPKIAHGDIIALRKIRGIRDALWGEPYVIVTFDDSQICTLKLIYQDTENSDTIILRSLNSAHPDDKTLQKSAIKETYKVLGAIRQFG